MYQYNLLIAGALWRIEYPKPLENGNCTPFVRENMNQLADLFIRYRYGMPEIRGTLVRNTYPRLYESEEAYYVEREYISEAATCIVLPKQMGKEYFGWVIPGKEHGIQKLDSLLTVSEFESIFSRLQGFCLHSSIIRRNGKAVLFSAPSGVGKSTQAELWKRYRGAEVLNGDRALIRKFEDRWTAFGSPFAGSSGIYRDDCAVIRTVVVLEQGLKNELKLLSPAQAFRHIYAESVIPRWNKEAQLRLLDVLTTFVQEVPIVKYQCLPDQSAVDYLDDYLSRGG